METIAATSTAAAPAPPVAFTVAVWLGMAREDILRGLADGSIAPPAGAPAGWTPPQWMPPQGSAPRVMTGVAATEMPNPPPIIVDDDRLPVVDRVRVQSWLSGTDPDTGERKLSESWIDDRANYVAWRNASPEDRAAAETAGTRWTFVDRTRVDAAGEPATLTLGSADAPDARHQVIFGSDGDEVITGGRGTDRIHGGEGNDVLRGGDGADLLDGGSGDDLLLGGGDGDDLDGGAGDDELDGGRGADRLDGGEGDDFLTGGRGDDLLQGGAGHDTYAIDAGDGVDTIIDADGDGALLLDGETVSGEAREVDAGMWTLADGKWTIALDGTVAEGGTLTLRKAPDAAGSGIADGGVIRVRDWHNGALGISLQAGPGAAESVDFEAPADAARPRFGVAPPPTVADLHDDGGDGVSQWQGSVASAATDTAAWDALFAGAVEGAGAAPMPMGAALPDLATIDRARANFAAVRAPSPLGRDATAGAADGGPMWMTLGAGDIAAALAGATADAGASDAMALDGGAMATALAGSTWSGLGGHDDTAWAASRHVATQHASPWSHVLTPPALLRSLT